MPHSFTLRLLDEISFVLEKVGTEIKNNGGIFKGTDKAGSFSGNSILGSIQGEYRCVSPDEIEIIITNKPFLVPYSKIESEIRKYFS